MEAWLIIAAVLGGLLLSLVYYVKMACRADIESEQLKTNLKALKNDEEISEIYGNYNLGRAINRMRRKVRKRHARLSGTDKGSG